MSAAFSAVSICSRAYDVLEHRPFDDFGDGSEEANLAARHWDAARRFVLAAVPWQFATAYARAEGAIVAVAPAATPYVVQLDPACIAFRAIDIEQDHIAVPFGDRRLRTDVAPPFTYEFTEDVAEPFRISPGCVEALVLYLAHLFAPKFSRDPRAAVVLLQRYEAMLDTAAAAEARNGTVADHRPGGIREGWTRVMGSQP